MSHPHDDLPRDPWLQQALRHAPDHDAAVPEAVRDTILTAARAAVRRPQPAPPRRWWQGGWPLGAPTRLGYSGALMALLVVGLWGVDQLERPAGSPDQRPDLSAPAAPQAAPVAETSPAPAPSATPTPKAAPATPAKPLPPVADLARAAPPPAEAMATAAAPPVESRARTALPSAPAAPPPSPAPVATLPAPPAAAPAPTPSPAMKPAAVAADRAAPEPAVALATAPAVMAEAAAPRRNEAAPQGLSRKAAAPSPSPLAQAREVWRQTASQRWQTPQAQGPHGEVQDAWLARLQAAVSGPWQAGTTPESEPRVRWVGTEGGQLWLAEDGSVWLAWRGQVHQAHLPAAEAAALLQALGGWR